MKSTIEQQVMGGVVVIHGARRLVNPTALKVYALVFSLGGIATLVSLSSVGHNFLVVEHGGISAVGIFFLSAVLGTSLMVQIALAVGVGALISLFAEGFQALRAHRPAHRMA